MKGITVELVDKQGVQHNTINLAQQQQERAGARLGQQERAINKWANGCEHGCRICRKLGETFTSFTRQGLLKHLKIEHEVSGIPEMHSVLIFPLSVLLQSKVTRRNSSA